MFTAYLAVVLVNVAALTYASTLDFVRHETVVANGRRLGVPLSLLVPLGVAKAAGAAGLLVGLAVRPIGTAAAIGLLLFFVLAIGTHLRAGDRSIGFAAGYGTAAGAALVLGLAA